MGRRILLVIAALTSAVIILPVAISLGLVGPSGLRLPRSGPTTPLGASLAEVLLDPAVNATDYEDPDHNVTIGSTVGFCVNISDVMDLFTWHIKLSWDQDILNGSVILYDDFLSSGTVSPNGTSSGVVDITSIFYEEGYGWAAESVLGDYAGVSGNGSLLDIQFDIIGYGHTYIHVNYTGSMPTELINSTGSSVPFATENGYFRNTIPGDLEDDVGNPAPDGDVDRYDFFAFLGPYGSSEGAPNYNILADLEDDVGGPPDGDVDRYDFFAFLGNYGRSVTLP